MTRVSTGNLVVRLSDGKGYTFTRLAKDTKPMSDVPNNQKAAGTGTSDI